MQPVTRIEATAELEDPGEAVALARHHAEREHDGEFAQLVRDWEAGRVLVVGVDVTVELSGEDGAPRRASCHAGGIWVERDIPPRVETQVRDIVPSELDPLARELADQGVEVSVDELAHMFVHVELGSGLRAELGRDA